MTGFVKIKNGTYRNTAIANEVFPLVKHYTVGAKGGFITVDGTGQFGKDKIRVLVESPTDIEFVHADEYTGVVTAKEVTATNTQTDEERIADIGLRFEMLDEMTKAVLNGDIRAMIVSGPPGVGKATQWKHKLTRQTYSKTLLMQNLNTLWLKVVLVLLVCTKYCTSIVMLTALLCLTTVIAYYLMMLV
jgi:hypothetical protein